MSLQLMSEVNNNYLLACCVHKELADVCWFGYFSGFAMLHEYQNLSESLTQRKIKRYITSTYHTFVPDKMPKSANIAELLLSGKNRKALKMDDSWKTVKEVFRIHREWEESSIKLYQQVAAQLVASGDVSTFNFVGELIRDVKEELVYVTDKEIEMNAMDWDMPTIVDQQTDYLERYEYLIRNLLGESKAYHHWNGNLDPKARTSVLDKSPE